LKLPWEANLCTLGVLLGRGAVASEPDWWGGGDWWPARDGEREARGPLRVVLFGATGASWHCPRSRPGDFPAPAWGTAEPAGIGCESQGLPANPAGMASFPRPYPSGDGSTRAAE